MAFGRKSERMFFFGIIASCIIYLVFDAIWENILRSFAFENFVSKLNSQTSLEIITVVVTNSCFLPCIIYLIRNEYYTESVIGCMTFLTSAFYHICKTARIQMWNMNDGHWHRLDNVFVILGCQCMAYFLLFATSKDQTALVDSPAIDQVHASDYADHFMHEQRVLNLFRWIGLSFCLSCQEKAPWVVFYTLLPIIVPASLAMIRMFLFVPKELRPRYNTRKMMVASVLFCIAMFFFTLGLDDEHDYLRIYHGFWHMFIGFSFYYYFQCKEQPKEKSNIE